MTIEKLQRSATASTPTVDFDPTSGVLRLSGESYPENAFEYFRPLLAWAGNYVSQARTPIVAEIALSYLNTSSIKSVMDLLDILEARQDPVPKDFHCFGGDANDARRAQALDCYFGVDGPLTYKNAQDLRDVVQTLPRDRVLIETDCPYLTPVPHRGKPNRPGYVTFVNNMLASLWGVEIEEAAAQTTRNAERFFRL